MTGELLARLDRLESEHAIRTLVATYFDLCDRLEAPGTLAELATLFSSDAEWSGRGSRYGTAFGAHRGRDAIITMLGRYAGPEPHFAFNAHFLGSERIAVDGNTASGRWMMLQTSTYTAGGSDLRAAALTLQFERLAEGWRIRSFETENLFSRNIDHWDDQEPIPVPD